jgi:gliding motility-associated-like protein
MYRLLKRLLSLGLFLSAFLSTSEVDAQVQLGVDRAICDTGIFNVIATSNVLYGDTIIFPGNQDDYHSPLIPLGFDFTYWGNTYDSVVFSSNFYITFDYSRANQWSPWSITDSLHLDPNTPENAIMCPWTDVHPGLPTSGNIMYGTYGTAPNRVFAVTFCELKMYSSSCSQYIFSSQIKLFEATNHFEIHIINKPACTSWNGGYAIMGLTDPTITNYMDIPGRNYPDVWTAQNEGWAFFAAGNSAYVSMQIPFNPVTTAPVGSSVLVEWLDSDSTVIGYGDTLALNVQNDTMVWAQLPICGTVQTTADSIYYILSGLATEIDSINDVGQLDCYGDQDGYILGSHSGGVGPVDYLWSNGSTSLSVSSLSSGTYMLSVTDSLNCRDEQQIVILEPDSIELEVLEVVDEACDQSNGRILLSSNGGTGNLSYSWNTSGTDSVQDNLNSGTYLYTVTDDNGCKRTGSSFVDLIPGPTASIWTLEDTLNSSNPVFAFVDSSIGAVSQWEWSFGDGNYAYVQDPIHTYGGVGVFNIMLNITDSLGCLDTALYTVYVVEEFYFYIPNAFSPNGDYLNAYFETSFVGISDVGFHFQVFDRWGKMVFETLDPDIHWDGTLMNSGDQILETGVYAYRVYFQSPSGKEFEERGTISLLK